MSVMTDIRHSKGEKVTAKAHGGSIDIQGVTVATVDDKLRLQSVHTWMDPMEMFRQIAPEGIVNKEAVGHKMGGDIAAEQVTAISHGGDNVSAEQTNGEPQVHSQDTQDMFEDTIEPNGLATKAEPAPESDLATVTASSDDDSKSESTPMVSSTIDVEAVSPTDANATANVARDAIDDHLEQSVDVVHPQPKGIEHAVNPSPGQAVAAPTESTETQLTREEMESMAPNGCPFLMNRE